jgi:hypothetical protein
MTPRAIVVGIAAFTLAACGGAAAATTDASETTVEQYASLIAGHDGQWRESVTTTDDACADSNAPDKCAAAYRTGSELAEALRNALSAARNDGEFPVEIAALVADTEAAAADYSAAYEAWEATSCANPLDWHCGADEAFAMFKAQGDLTRQLDAWAARRLTGL